MSPAVAQAASLQSGEFQTKEKTPNHQAWWGFRIFWCSHCESVLPCMNMERKLALNSSGIVSAGPWSTSKNRYMSDAKGTDLHSKLSSWSILWRRVGTLPRQLQTSKSLARSQSLHPISTTVSVYKCRLGWTRVVGAQLRYTVAHIPVVGTGRTNSSSKLSAVKVGDKL